ncbi:type VI secretion system tip protein VgrG [Flavivirga abyssicola]|uniref:type VI secretion system tip protein VgrG n=1 Tax=Flavivirga abyssicola TaxID=3063533 RepID=UPI0026E042BD|nr:type VI secretion system tip protein VgrG [Flavivirga sp. MEBiC07777]WVK12621.1 type VI secretion system tip protein VgrG [Flavivirga sp. MEBiC07777]
MASSPIISGNNLVSFTITSEGDAIPDTYGVVSVNISQEIDTIAQAQITVRDGDPTTQMFEIADASTFKTGNAIEIALGYGTDTTTIFSGEVTKQSVKVDESGTTFQVTCKDILVKAVKSKSKLVLTDSLDSDAIDQIVENLGVESNVTATTVQKEKIIQYSATDWDFIVSRAQRNGMAVVTDNGTLVVSAITTDDEPALELQYGRDIMEMDIDLESIEQSTSLSINAWTPSEQDSVNSEASEPTVNEQGDASESDLESITDANEAFNTSIPLTEDEAQQISDAWLLRKRMSKYRGSIKFPGSADAKPNTLISLTGLGELFDGDAYISSVSHSFSGGNWSTEIQIGVPPEVHSQKVKTAPSEPGTKDTLIDVKGMQVGIVKDTYDEDGGEFRVQVEIPILNDTTEFVWARLASYYASSSFGAYFYPEVGDEVILGFIDGNPAYPVILGSMYSSSLQPPEVVSDSDNNIKMLMTRSQLQFKFDDENIVMTMVTPNGNTVVISDQDEGITITDQNSNQIQMNSSGITIESKSAMTIKAADDLTIQGSSVKITADNDVSISGSSISASASNSATLNGDSGCTVSSSGETNISGSAINLN